MYYKNYLTSFLSLVNIIIIIIIIIINDFFTIHTENINITSNSRHQQNHHNITNLINNNKRVAEREIASLPDPGIFSKQYQQQQDNTAPQFQETQHQSPKRLSRTAATITEFITAKSLSSIPLLFALLIPITVDSHQHGHRPTARPVPGELATAPATTNSDPPIYSFYPDSGGHLSYLSRHQEVELETYLVERGTSCSTKGLLLLSFILLIIICIGIVILINCNSQCLTNVILFHAIHHHIIMPTNRFVQVHRKAWMSGGNNDQRTLNNNNNNNNNNNSNSNNNNYNSNNNSNNNIYNNNDSIRYINNNNILSRRSRVGLFMDNLRLFANCSNNLDNSNSASSSSNSRSLRHAYDASDLSYERSYSKEYVNGSSSSISGDNKRDQTDDDRKMYKFQVLKFYEIHPKSTKNPKARSGHRMVADDKGDLYSFGGFNVKVARDDNELSEDPFWQTFNPLFRELWKYNWRTTKWEKLYTEGDVPEKLVSHCMGYINDKLIIYGGTGWTGRVQSPFGEKSSNELTIYHIKRNYWETIKPVSDPALTPHEMYGQAMAIDENRGDIYIIGGTNGFRYSLDVHKFNLYSKKWTPLFRTSGFENDPGSRYRHEIALYNNKLYLFGGGTNNRCYSFRTLPVFDLETCDWSFCRSIPYRIGQTDCFPEARKCHSLAVLDKDCYVCGGTSGQQICPDIWHIDLDTLKWTRIVPGIPYPVYFHAASVGLQGQLNIFGGVDHKDGNSRNNYLTSIWLKIPSLKTICLLALRHYVHEKILDTELVPSTGMDEASEIAS